MKNNKRVSYKEATKLSKANGFELWKIHQLGKRGKHYVSYYLYRDDMLVLHVRLLKDIKNYIVNEKQVKNYIYQFGGQTGKIERV